MKKKKNIRWMISISRELTGWKRENWQTTLKTTSLSARGDWLSSAACPELPDISHFSLVR
jgi:hypothetical protein